MGAHKHGEGTICRPEKGKLDNYAHTLYRLVVLDAHRIFSMEEQNLFRLFVAFSHQLILGYHFYFSTCSLSSLYRQNF